MRTWDAKTRLKTENFVMQSQAMGNLWGANVHTAKEIVGSALTGTKMNHVEVEQKCVLHAGIPHGFPLAVANGRSAGQVSVANGLSASALKSQCIYSAAVSWSE